MLSQWQMTRFESGKVGKCLQKYIIRSAKKQRYIQKLCFKKLSKWRVTGIESGKVFRRLQKYIIRIAENQVQFLKLIQNVIKMTCDWN